ncbi:MAG TPA: creatininase family protein [Candidatus Saccharimonadales bacterium]|nr:creatininase family protein [Candidatus Saccharimonadales bacterium]
MIYIDQTKDSIRDCLSLPVILPLGSVEQHGGHLPLSTDTATSSKVVEEAEQHSPNTMITLPVQWVGHAGEHMAFPGTLSISQATLASYLEDILRSLEHSGFSKLIIVNSHGGNDILLDKLVRSWSGNIKLIIYDVWSKEADELGAELFGGSDNHAGDTESSVMATIRPDLVKNQVITNGYVEPAESTSDSPLNMSENGVDNFKPDIIIDRKKAEPILEQMVIDFIRFVDSV